MDQTLGEVRAEKAEAKAAFREVAAEYASAAADGADPESLAELQTELDEVYEAYVYASCVLRVVENLLRLTLAAAVRARSIPPARTSSRLDLTTVADAVLRRPSRSASQLDSLSSLRLSSTSSVTLELSGE